ncbi:MAG TPA: NAD regulator [Xanthobacteraceae bacterium]|nr:NAD regulator [Xanthobacteraceae bacterium]
MAGAASTQIEVGLTAAIVAMEGIAPQILTVGSEGEATRLPSGPFEPVNHRTFEIALRTFVAEQTALAVGYIEQLYTFGDRGRHARIGDMSPHVLSVGYLALTRMPKDEEALARAGARFEPWYNFFPWEDWRGGRPKLLNDAILPELHAWAKAAARESGRALGRKERVKLAFGLDGIAWDEEKVLERYELLYEAGLAEEAKRDGREAALARKSLTKLGVPMRFDHRRILATAIARLRAKLKYRPVVFELMPSAFTLTALQNTVEAIAGRHLHKQNFRRLVDSTALVEPTGESVKATGGRPAALFRFRREVVEERPAPGLRFGSRG